MVQVHQVKVVFTQRQFLRMFETQEMLDEFRLKYNVSMTVLDELNNVVLVVGGLRARVQAAEEVLLASLIFIIAEVSIPWKKHYLVIGKKGESINQLRSKFTKRFNIRVPRFELQYDIIEVSGNDVDQIEQVISTMKAQLAIKEAEWQERMAQEVTVEMQLPCLFHGLVIGRSGVTIKRLRSDHNVRISLPGAGDELSGTISIRGKLNDCLAAKEAIHNLPGIPAHYVQVELPYIPPDCIHIIMKIEESLWELNDTHNVESLFTLVERPQPKAIAVISARDGGTMAQCQLAQDQLRQLWPIVRQVAAQPHQLRLVIGKNGETIRKIRIQHQVTVIVPPKEEAHGDASCHVTLIGSLENVDAAQVHLMNILSRHLRHRLAADPEYSSEIFDIQ